MNWMMTNKPHENPSFKVSGISTPCLFRYVIFLSFLFIFYLQPRKPTAAIQGHPNFICIFLPLDPNNPWTPKNEGNVCSHGSRYWQFWPQEVGAQGSQIYTHQQIVFWEFETFAAASTTWLVVSTHLKNMFKLDHETPRIGLKIPESFETTGSKKKVRIGCWCCFLMRDLFNKTWQFVGENVTFFGMVSSVTRTQKRSWWTSNVRWIKKKSPFFWITWQW